LVAQIREGLAFAQVLIRRTASGFELRHVADRERAAGTLRELALTDVRALAQFTATGAFRPLKCAPDLQNGWLFSARDDDQLEGALNQLCPGAVADWFAAQSPTPPVTHYREFAGRQTGMYRITTMLTDSQAAKVIRACCHKEFCLKRRFWRVDGLTADEAEEKSLIPCLEPCAVLLEFARKAVRIEQEEKVELPLSQSEALSLKAALQTALEHPDREASAGDFGAPANPRRLQLLLEKLAALPIKTTVKAEE